MPCSIARGICKYSGVLDLEFPSPTIDIVSNGIKYEVYQKKSIDTKLYQNRPIAESVKKFLPLREKKVKKNLITSLIIRDLQLLLTSS
ncbi:hypothetical protein C4579_02085 [Candidatus Microgenomates bacterium]|nr:MAG: hypothetical protein C4579_02085 [Candidatus Microgenomates bacterium]